MKTKLFFLLLCLPGVLLAQLPSGKAEEIKLPGREIKTIVIAQPIDTVYAFLAASGYLEHKTGAKNPAELETIVTDVQTFTDQETFDAFRKAGKEFYNVYGYSIPAKWKLTLKAIDKQQTAVGFQLQSYYLDPESDNYNDAKAYRQYGQIVSNGNLEGLLQIYAEKHFAKAPIVAVPFSREKGYDNRYYVYSDFIPGKNFEESGIWNAVVPRANSKALAAPAFILYDKSAGMVFSVNEKDLKINWQQKVPAIAKAQNHNDFTIYDQVIYVPANNGSLSAIDAATGELYWQCTPMGKAKAAAAGLFGQQAPVSGDLVYINDNNCIYAINRFTGKVAWSQKHGGYGHYNYSIDDRYLYKSGILELLQIDKRNGEVHKVINSTQANTFYFPNLLTDSDHLILCDGDTYGYDLKKDTITWKQDFSYNHIAYSADRKHCYLDTWTDNKAIISINPRNGKTEWQCSLPLEAEEYMELLQFSYDKGQIFVLSQVNKNNTPDKSYRLFVIDAAKGKIVHNKRLPARPLSALLVGDQEIALLTLNGFTRFNRRLGTFTAQKTTLSSFLPDSNYSLHAIGRISNSKE